MPLGIGPPGQPGPHPQLRDLKETVRTLLGLDDDTAAVVRQLACTEPGCPPLETVIAVLPCPKFSASLEQDGTPIGEARRWTLHRPSDQITEDDLRAALLHTPDQGACA